MPRIPTALAKAAAASAALRPEDARAIAKDACIYGFPLVDNYRVLHAYFVDSANPEYKGGWNEVHSTARVYTPDDRAIQTPNSDTPYSMVGADLRAEPLVFSVPKIEGARYYALQFIDLYTFNFAYVGSRATGNDEGHFLLAGPSWEGQTPPGIRQVIRCETDLAFVLYRTQLFSPDDIGNVMAVQAGYRVQTLSSFLGKAAPAPAPAIDFVTPISPHEERGSLEFFNELNFVLQFCPPHPSETEMMARFEKLGIGADGEFHIRALAPDLIEAAHEGMRDAWDAFDAEEKRIADGSLGSGDLFGTRDALKNNYLYRMMGAVNGIYGNTKEEAIYPAYLTDSQGNALDGSVARYALRFAADGLPPANAFWSLTMYSDPDKMLVANPLRRYLINSPMLPGLTRGADGSVTLNLQHDSPGVENEANWLPAPAGPFFCALRIYWPKAEALDGTWSKPPLLRIP
jgi:hypothetical protein